MEPKRLTDEQLVGYAQAIELAEIAGVRVVFTHQEATALLAHADALAARMADLEAVLGVLEEALDRIASYPTILDARDVDDVMREIAKQALEDTAAASRALEGGAATPDSVRVKMRLRYVGELPPPEWRDEDVLEDAP